MLHAEQSSGYSCQPTSCSAASPVVMMLSTVSCSSGLSAIIAARYWLSKNVSIGPCTQGLLVKLIQSSASEGCGHVVTLLQIRI